MTHVCFCGVLARHLDVPAVARALDRLRDEVTVSACIATSTQTDARTGRNRLRSWRRQRSITKAPFQRALDALSYGPLPIALLAEDVYGPPVADREEMLLRHHRVRALMRRQMRYGRVVRVGEGVYALPGKTEGMVERGPADCRAILADPRVQPVGGLTTAELAERLDISVVTIRRWLARLRREGVPLVAVRLPFNGRGSGGFRYRVEHADREVA